MRLGAAARPMVEDHPCEYNRIVPIRCMERSERELYAFGPTENRWPLG